LGLTITKFSIFPLSASAICHLYTKFLTKINKKNLIWLRLDTTFTKKWTIDMQKKRPMTKNPHPIFKPKYNIHELSDDIRICDFTCQPDLIIAEKKYQDPAAFARGQKTQPTQNISFRCREIG
jgi:hypothetical protein